METLILLEKKLISLKQQEKEIQSDITSLKVELQDRGAWWLLFELEYDGRGLTCNKCIRGVLQDKEKCKPCPSYKRRFLMTKNDINEIVDRFEFASR